MKILILNWRDVKHAWAGGSEIYIFELAKRWASEGHKVTLFCGQDVGGGLKNEETIDGIKIYRRGNQYTIYFWAMWYYLTRLRKECDVVVDIQNGIPFFSVLYSRKPKVAIAYHVHRMQWFFEIPFPLNFVGYIFERFFFPFFYSRTKIIAISKTTKRELIKIGFPKDNIHIVYSGVVRKKNGNGKKFSQPTILYLGRIKKYKRVDMLIRIMPAILKRIPNARLIIAGWGTEAARVTDASMKSVIRKRIKILGPVSESEKKYFLSQSWVFVNPSIGEGWGIAVIEANLYKTPTVAFNVQGLSESVQHGKTGFLAENEKDFINKICLILENAKLRKTLSKNSARWAKNFNWDDASRESLEILKQLK